MFVMMGGESMWSDFSHHVLWSCSCDNNDDKKWCTVYLRRMLLDMYLSHAHRGVTWWTTRVIMSRGILLERLPLGPKCHHTKVILTDYTVKRFCSRGTAVSHNDRASVHTGGGWGWSECCAVAYFGAGHQIVLSLRVNARAHWRCSSSQVHLASIIYLYCALYYSSTFKHVSNLLTRYVQLGSKVQQPWALMSMGGGLVWTWLTWGTNHGAAGQTGRRQRAANDFFGQLPSAQPSCSQ